MVAPLAPELQAEVPGVQQTLGAGHLSPELGVVAIGFGRRHVARDGHPPRTRVARIPLPIANYALRAVAGPYDSG